MTSQQYSTLGEILELTQEEAEKIIREESKRLSEEWEYFQTLVREVGTNGDGRKITEEEWDFIIERWNVHTQLRGGYDAEEVLTIFPLEDDFIEPEVIRTINNYYVERIEYNNIIERERERETKIFSRIYKKLSERKFENMTFYNVVDGWNGWKGLKKDCEKWEYELKKFNEKVEEEEKEVKKEIANRKEKISLILRLRMLPIELRARGGEKGGLLEHFEALFNSANNNYHYWLLMKNNCPEVAERILKSLDKESLLNLRREIREKFIKVKKEKEYQLMKAKRRLERTRIEIIMENLVFEQFYLQNEHDYYYSLWEQIGLKSYYNCLQEKKLKKKFERLLKKNQRAKKNQEWINTTYYPNPPKNQTKPWNKSPSQIPPTLPEPKLPDNISPLKNLFQQAKFKVETLLTKYRLKVRDLPKQYHNWEQKIGQMTTLKEVEEFMKRMEQAITSASQQQTIKPSNNFTTPWKLVIGLGVILLLVEIVYVYYLWVKREIVRKGRKK